MFNTQRPFARGGYSADTDLMVDCFVALFRLSPHSKDLLRILLDSASPAIFRNVLVCAFYRIATQPPLTWWADIDLMYNNAADLRIMFGEALKAVIQAQQQQAPQRLSQVRGWVLHRVCFASLSRRNNLFLVFSWFFFFSQ